LSKKINIFSLIKNFFLFISIILLIIQLHINFQNIGTTNFSDKDPLVGMLKILQSILDTLNEKLFNNIIVGQTILVINENFDAQMNKISTNNIKSICVSNSDSKLKRKNFKRIRRLQAPERCSSDSVLGIDPNILSNLMKNQTSSNVGFYSQLNKNKNLPIDTNAERTIFSESALDFGLSTGDKKNQFRNLNTNNLNINFEIRLKIPRKKNENDNSTNVGDTTCVQYQKASEKDPDVSCVSWYDDLNSEVVCVCNKQGLTVNVADKALSNIGKLGQFPGLGSDLCK